MRRRRKKIVIWCSVVATVLIALTAAVAATSEIELTLNGDEVCSVEVFSEYVDDGASAQLRMPLLFGAKVKLPVSLSDSPDTNKIGEYQQKYKAGYLFKSQDVTRTVNVVDTVAPTIETDENFFEVSGGQRLDSADKVTVGAVAKDNYDGDITSKITKEIKDDICYYKVSDSSGNSVQTEIHIVYIDTEGPKINLKGNSTVFMAVDTAYKEFGYTVTDNLDKNIEANVKVLNTVDMSKTGTYIVSYTATDDAGNSSTVTRRVIVYGGGYDSKYDTVTPNGKVIYMTFDDGPGQYTERLLNTLADYKVKATFFVTNQFTKYQHLLTRINNDGHTVALHTLTHRWDIYSSVDSYMNDFNGMNSIIESYTGKPTRIFRFPGGTGNTVSSKHCKGIMTTLSKQMTDMGYTYFDWNVDANDSTLKEPSDIINTLISQISGKDRSIVLMHDIQKATVDAVPGFIEYCLKNGYTFKVIDETTEPYRHNPRN